MTASAHKIFICYGEEEHVDQVDLVQQLNSASGFAYTNTGSCSGEGIDRESLERNILRQIEDAAAVVVPSGMFLTYGFSRWVRFQVAHAKAFKRPIVVLTPHGSVGVPRYLKDYADKTLVWNGNPKWDASDLVDWIRALPN